jgi:hypothetical protein
MGVTQAVASSLKAQAGIADNIWEYSTKHLDESLDSIHAYLSWDLGIKAVGCVNHLLAAYHLHCTPAGGRYFACMVVEERP